MDERRAVQLYDEYVVAHGLERLALLDALRASFERPPAVLYPGCFLHVTPSIFFQHVVYVDRNELARAFFAREANVRAIVGGRKRYRQEPFVRFVAQDFTEPLPFGEESFDLLLALYASDVSRSCARYVCPGGFVLTNDHHGDARDAAAMPELELVAVAEQKGEAVRFLRDDLRGYLEPALAGRRRGGAMRSPYVRSADYYLFRKRVSRT